MRTWFTADAWMPLATMASNSCLLYAMPPPEPPSVNAGRMMSGYEPISSDTAMPCSSL